MDGVTGGPKTIVEPEGYLRSALEKIVFFECRVSQLESELAAARGVAERARGDAAAAHRKAVDLEQRLAGERGARADAEARAAERDERVRLLEAERERLLGGLVDRARVAGATGDDRAAGDDDGQADLAGFIAELRAEIEALRAFKAAVVDASAQGPVPFGVRQAPAGAQRDGADGGVPERRADRGHRSSLSDLAGGFQRDGRVGLGAADAARMKELLATRADRALYERSMDDLAATDAGRRLRAVRALEALDSRAAAPLLAATLGREEDEQVKAALLSALARFKEPFAAGLAERALGDARPVVRIAALEALASVSGAGAGERLAAALSDESPLVRRRAALLLGFQAGERAEEALAIALADGDRGVARTAAAALSGRPSVRAQEALARGLEHGDASVRRAAAVSLSRLSGEKVDADAPASARRAASRRIAERLAGMDADELRAAVLRSTATARATAERVMAATGAPARAPAEMPAAAPAPVSAPARSAASSARTAVAVLASPVREPATFALRQAQGERTHLEPLAAAPRQAAGIHEGARPEGSEQGTHDLEPLLVAEIRAALRGCTAEGLANVLGAPAARVEAALQALAVRGAVARRGTRWFTS